MNIKNADKKIEKVLEEVKRIWKWIDVLDKRFTEQNIPSHDSTVKQVVKQLDSLLPTMSKVPYMKEFVKSLKSNARALENTVYTEPYKVYMKLNIVKDLLHHSEYRLEETLRLVRGEHIPYKIVHDDAQARMFALPELTLKTFPKFELGKEQDGFKMMSNYQKVADEREWFFHRLLKIHCGEDMAEAFWVYLHDKGEMDLMFSHEMYSEGRDDDFSTFAKAWKRDLISTTKLLEAWGLMLKLAALSNLKGDREIDLVYNQYRKLQKKIDKQIEKDEKLEAKRKAEEEE